MSDLIEEFPSFDSDNFGFKSVGASIQLVSDFEEKLPFKSINNLSFSPLTGLFAAAGASNVVIGDSRSLRRDIEDEDKTSYETNSKNLKLVGVNNVAFTKDDKHLVLSIGSTLKYCEVYKTSYRLLDESSFKEIELSSEISKVTTSYESGPNAFVLDIDSILYQVDITTGAKSPIRTNVIDFDLSPTDGSIITIRKFGIELLGRDGRVIKSIDIPSDVKEEEISALAVTSLKENLYLVTCGEEVLYNEAEEPNYTFKQFIVNGAASPATFSESFDVIPAFGTVWRKPTIYDVSASRLSQSLQTLNIVASSTSSDISPLTETELLVPLNDTERAVLPMNDESGNDTNAIGLVLDTRSAEKVIEPCPGVSEADWLPIVWSLGSDGKITGWYIFHVRDLKNKTFNADSIHVQEKQIVESASNAEAFEESPEAQDSKTLFSIGSVESAEKSTVETQSPFASLASDLMSNLDSEQARPSAFGLSESKHSLPGSSETKPPLPESSGSNQSPFGSSATHPSLFGTKRETQKVESPFGGLGGSSSTEQKPFSFGTSTDLKPNFGSSSAKTEEPKLSLGSSAFGSANTKPGFGSPGFGSTGFPSTESKPAFGSTLTSNETKSAFGSSTFGSFSQPKSDGTPSKPASHGFGSSGFGSSSFKSPADLNKPAFGSSGFGSSGFGSSGFGSSGFGSSGFGSSSFGSSGPGANTSNAPTKTKISAGSSGFASFANKPGFGTAIKSNDPPFRSLGDDKKSESPFGSAASASNTDSPFAKIGSAIKTESPFGSFGIEPKSNSTFASFGSQSRPVETQKANSPFGSTSSEKKDSPFAHLGVKPKADSPFANLGLQSSKTEEIEESKSQLDSANKVKVESPFGLFGSGAKPTSPIGFGNTGDKLNESNSLFGSSNAERKEPPFAKFSGNTTFGEQPGRSKKDKLSFGDSKFSKGLESGASSDEEDDNDEYSDASSVEQPSFKFEPTLRDEEEEEREQSEDEDEPSEEELELSKERTEMSEGDEDSEEELKEEEEEEEDDDDDDDEVELEGTPEDYGQSYGVEEESFQGFEGNSIQGATTELEESEIRDDEFDDEEEELAQAVENELKIEEENAEAKDKSDSLKSSDEELYEKAKLLGPSGSPVSHTIEPIIEPKVEQKATASAQATIETRDQAFTARAEQSSTSVQTEPVETKSVGVEAFEDDELYVGSQSLPTVLSQYINLKDIKYPNLSTNPVVREIEKIVYDTDTEISIVEENCQNIGAFIKDQLNPPVKHTEKSLGHSYQWRISEAKDLLEILGSKLPIAGKTKEELSSKDKVVAVIEAQLKSFEQQAKNISEKILTIENSKDQAILNARDIPYESLLLQEQVRKHYGIVVSNLREAEQKLLYLKAAANVLTDDFTHTNVLKGVISYINDATRTYASDTKKLTEGITKLNKNNEKILEKLSSQRSDEFIEKEFASKSIGKLNIDNVTKRIATENAISQVLRQRSITEITSEF